MSFYSKRGKLRENARADDQIFVGHNRGDRGIVGWASDFREGYGNIRGHIVEG